MARINKFKKERKSQAPAEDTAASSVDRFTGDDFVDSEDEDEAIQRILKQASHDNPKFVGITLHIQVKVYLPYSLL